MKFDTACFLIDTPLTERDYKRFSVDALKSKGFEVIFLDLTSMLNSEYINKYKPANLVHGENITAVKDKKDFYIFFENNRNKKILAIDLVGGRRNTIFIYRIFKKFNITYINLCINTKPSPQQKRQYKSKFFKKTLKKSNIFKKIKGRFIDMLYRMPYFTNIIKPPAGIVVDGFKCNLVLPRAGESTKMIWAHSLDYDLYLDYLHGKLSLPSISEKRYITFLDEFTPFHPDFYLSTPSLPNPFFDDPLKYYEIINKFLSLFEEKTKTNVVIAAHPRSQYENMPNMYNGRTVIKGKTIELIAKSEAILTHASTAVSFAVFFNKPIIFLTSDRMKEEPIYGDRIDNYAAIFNKKSINMDKFLKEDIPLDLTVDEKIYSDYINNYIKIDSSPKQYFWDIVLNHV